MKRIVSFVILTVLFVVILASRAVETPPAVPHPIPVWSILLYLAVVAAAGAAGVMMRREKTEPVMA
jgi:drug/metabolite transporter (DMT)-like permease